METQRELIKSKCTRQGDKFEDLDMEFIVSCYNGRVWVATISRHPCINKTKVVGG